MVNTSVCEKAMWFDLQDLIVLYRRSHVKSRKASLECRMSVGKHSGRTGLLITCTVYLDLMYSVPLYTYGWDDLAQLRAK